MKEYPASQSRDQQSYIWASHTLRWGMYVSFGAMVAGLVWWLLAGAVGGQASAAQLIALDKLLPELSAGNPLALLNLGIVLLLATPGVTLIAIIVTYAAAHNWRYAGIAAFVAAILLLSLAISLKWIVLF